MLGFGDTRIKEEAEAEWQSPALGLGASVAMFKAAGAGWASEELCRGGRVDGAWWKEGLF